MPPTFIMAPAAFLIYIAIVGAAAAAKVPAVIVFGDSSVDSGNNNWIPTIAKSNFRPYGRDFFGGVPTGRFSNGRIAPDFISEAFGLRPFVPAYLDPQYNISDFAQGVCFASAGTGFDNATSDVLRVIPLWKEVEYFKEYKSRLLAHLGDTKANFVISEALYLISLGTNDFLENYYNSRSAQAKYTVEQYQDFLIGLAGKFMKDIYTLGARKMSMTPLPPMGCLPLQRAKSFMKGKGDECYEEYNAVAAQFNEKLSLLVNKTNEELPGIRVVYSTSYEFFKGVIQTPFVFGFEKSAVACCGTGVLEMGYLCNELNPFTCADASKYVFWDSFHPSERTSRIISEYLMEHSLHEFL